MRHHLGSDSDTIASNVLRGVTLYVLMFPTCNVLKLGHICTEGIVLAMNGYIRCSHSHVSCKVDTTNMPYIQWENS